MIFVANHKAPEILKPGKQPFYFPSALIWSEHSAILRFGFFTPFTMRGYNFNMAIIKQAIVKFITIIGFIAYEFIWSIWCLCYVLSCRQQYPFFCRCETTVYERFSNVDLSLFIQVLRKLLGNALENPLCYPLLEPSMADLVQRIPLRQVLPWRTCSQNPQDSMEHLSQIACLLASWIFIVALIV